MKSPELADLLDFTEELVAIPSVSHEEAAICDHLARYLAGAPHLRVDRLGDNLVARTQLGRKRRLILAGHLDTVPPFSVDGPRRQGDQLHGLGAVDMKGGLAVLTWLACAASEPALDLTYVFYACEEVARAHSGLGLIQRQRPDLLQADAAILAEPTDGLVEGGCQGTLRMELLMAGRRAHTARPWQGVNAIHRAAAVITKVAGWPGREVVLDGCRFRESLQVVAVEGGIAGNVVPDSARLVLNHRFAPDRSSEDAYEFVSSLIEGSLEEGDAVSLVDSAGGAAPGLDNPLMSRLVALSGAQPRAKLGWTDVARFAEMGLPAANYGPGDPELAHTAGEWVDQLKLERAASVLWHLVSEES